MSTQPDDESEFHNPSGPSLSADGKLEGVERPVRPEDFQSRGENPVPQSELPLELVERAPPVPQERIETFRELPAEPPKSRAPLYVVLGAFVLGAGILGLFLAFRPRLEGVLVPRAAQLLLINSEPSGAKVFIGGEQVGETPWAGDNRWQSIEQVPVKLERAGYKPWEGFINGNAPQNLEVVLKKR